MINLFFIVHNFSGARTYADELLDYMKDKVHVFLILMDDKDHKEFTIEEINKITTIYIPKCIKKDISPKYYKNIGQLLYACYKGLNNTVVHVNMPEQFYLAEELKKQFKCKVIYTMHYLENFYSYFDKIEEYTSNIKISGNELLKKMIRLADMVICVTEFAKRSLLKIYNIEIAKIHLIYNGIGFKTHNSQKLKEQYGFKKDDRLILYAGQLLVGKGVEKLIKAFEIIKNRFQEIKLVIAGAGDYSRLNQLTSNFIGRVHFTGKLNKNTLYDFYCFSEIGIIPSQFEQCSYVAIEMMHCGLPIIISDVPGLNELILHNKTGIVCKTHPHERVPNALEVDESDLAKQIDYLLSNPNISTRIGLAAKEHARLYYSQEIMGEKTWRVYRTNYEIENYPK